MERVAFLLGSNMGDSRGTLSSAIALMEERLGRVVSKSRLYSSEPWGMEAENDFLNQAVVIETELTPNEVLEGILEIERMLGRVRKENSPSKVLEHTEYTSRSIDIDIIFYGSRVIDEERLQVPHPRMQDRNFVLTPLSEIMPDFMHPVLKKKVQFLQKECSDNGEIHAVEE